MGIPLSPKRLSIDFTSIHAFSPVPNGQADERLERWTKAMDGPRILVDLIRTRNVDAERTTQYQSFEPFAAMEQSAIIGVGKRLCPPP